jgi:23S rRNA (uracil1939-C5)-methyltransferase
VLHPRVACLITPLAQLIEQFTCSDQIPQIELAVADPQPALIIRHLMDFSKTDHDLLIAFAKKQAVSIYLQPHGLASVHKFFPSEGSDLLSYQHKDHNITLQFHPNDFTQVNFSINEKLVNLAIELLDLQKTDKVLDLFCGLGNFTLPIARYCQHVTAIEGNANMVARGQHNATLNGLANITFIATDLNQDFDNYSWAQQHYDKILIDPPRCGAEHIVLRMKQFSPKKLIYISCNPATLARDAGILQQQGYQLELAGVMDMFPHTKHVESIAVFNNINCSK